MIFLIIKKRYPRREEQAPGVAEAVLAAGLMKRADHRGDFQS